MSRPSASVLMMSTVFPFIARTTSPGRDAPGPGMFSTAGAIARSGTPGASLAAVTAAASTVHAPVLSIFISSIRSECLMLIPPESKQTPLPTNASRRPTASVSPSAPERRTIIRGGFALPCPTARNIPIPSSAARFSSSTSTQRPCAAELGMGMFLAVGQGSANPPRMIVLRSGADGETDAVGRRLAFVGKGVCFDSGGISIKPSDKMEEMKMDKTGACTVLAAAVTAARLAPGVPLLAIAPAVENMPGPGASRPGDVVRAMNGKTVDIINTDAEGRLILGDAMTYAEHLGATHVVDVATLTGAVARAFGHLVTGAFGDPQCWYHELTAAAARAGERFWQLPLVDEYWPEMDSWTADMVNSSSPEAGLIKSALFLRQFVSVPWIHLDIAGSAYYRKPTAWAPHGATGVATATLVELALAGAR